MCKEVILNKDDSYSRHIYKNVKNVNFFYFLLNLKKEKYKLLSQQFGLLIHLCVTQYKLF